MKTNLNIYGTAQIKYNTTTDSNDKNKVMRNKSTPSDNGSNKDLFQLAKTNNWPTITSLVKNAKIDINARDHNDYSALDLAVKSGDTVSIQRLLDLGIDATAPGTFGVTPLHLAVLYDHKEAIVMLLKHGVNANISSSSGETSLHTAAAKSNLEALQLLEKFGGDVKGTDKSGRSILHCAAIGITQHKARWEMIEWLLGKGADGLAKTKQGQTVRDYFAKTDWSYADHYDQLLENLDNKSE